MSDIPLHDPIFDEFVEFKGEVPAGFFADFIGTLTDRKFQFSYSESLSPATHTGQPQFGEDYFGWIDLLTSVSLADDRFTMFELGAGYGRTSVCAEKAARQKGITDIHLTLVEAEPLHAQWLREHIVNNNVRSDVRIIEAAAGAVEDQIFFYVGMPDDSVVSQAEGWYGQSKIQPTEQFSSPNLNEYLIGTYQNQNVVKFASGWKAIVVPQKPLAPMMDGHHCIDLLDLDVQGAEFEVLSAAIDGIDTKVKRLHIGTHGHDLEQQLLALFSARGWTCLRNYPCHSTNATPFGDISFVDGVQTWINPRFA